MHWWTMTQWASSTAKPLGVCLDESMDESKDEWMAVKWVEQKVVHEAVDLDKHLGYSSVAAKVVLLVVNWVMNSDVHLEMSGELK